MTALILKLGMIKGGFGEQEELRGQFEGLEADAKQLDRDVNFLVCELRPPALDDLGLQAVLTRHTRNWSKHFNIAVKLYVTGMERDRLTPETETALYRRFGLSYIDTELREGCDEVREAKTLLTITAGVSNEFESALRRSERLFRQTRTKQS